MTAVIDKISEALVREDIEGLINLGAPQDEYTFEARKIAEAVGAAKLSEDEIADIIAEVWVNSFGLQSEDLDKRLPGIKVVAREIVNQARGLDPRMPT